MSTELALTPDSRWDVTTSQLTEATAAAGFGALGLSVDRAMATDTTAAGLAAAGLRCHEILALAVSANAERTRSRAEKAAQAAGQAGAPWVLTVFSTPITTQTAASLRECAAIVADAGARLALEFSPLGPVQTIADALEGVEVVGPERAGVLIDSWHFCRGPSTWQDLASVPLEQVAYLQFDDAPPARSEDAVAETMDRRLFPGDGEFALERFADTFLRRGWEGLVSVEVLSDELRHLDIREFARRAYGSAARYWR
jgi:sugar phosphate isomerase/epimerase